MTTDLVILYWPDMYYKLPNAYQPIKHKIYLPAGGKSHWQTGWEPWWDWLLDPPLFTEHTEGHSSASAVLVNGADVSCYWTGVTVTLSCTIYESLPLIYDSNQNVTDTPLELKRERDH